MPQWLNRPLDGQTAFMGAEFEVDGVVHYGWVRIASSLAAGGTFLDYAYESTPGESIAAGAIPEPQTLSLILLGGTCMSGLLRLARRLLASSPPRRSCP